jgi:prophage antirepressor-like protein
MNIIKAFNNNDLNVNVTIRGTLEAPLFRASDVGNVLENVNIRTAIMDFDETEKITQVMDSSGGPQNVSFITQKGLFKLLFRSKKPIAEHFQNWVCEVIKEIHMNGRFVLLEQLQANMEKNKLLAQKSEETRLLLEEAKQTNEKIPKIYIYNCDTQINPPELKIGYSSNVSSVIKQYKKIRDCGRLEFTVPIINYNITIVKHFIHNLLSPYKIQGEVFKLDVEDAKITILHVVNLLNVSSIPNQTERFLKLKQMYEIEVKVLNDIDISTNEISTQTNFDEL